MKAISSYKNYIAKQKDTEAYFAAEQEMSELTKEVYNKIINLEFESALDIAYKIYNEDPNYPGRSLLISDIYYLIANYNKAIEFLENEIDYVSSESTHFILMTSKIKLFFYNNRFAEFKKSLANLPDYCKYLKFNIDKSSFLIKRCELYIYSNEWSKARIDLNNAKNNMHETYWMKFYSYIIDLYYQDFDNCFEYFDYVNEPNNRSKYNFYLSNIVVRKIIENTDLNDSQKLFFELLLYEIGYSYQSKSIKEISPQIINGVLNNHDIKLKNVQKDYLKSNLDY